MRRTKTAVAAAPMKSLRSGVALAASLALMVPVAATAQEQPEDVLQMPDPAGDLRDLGDEPVEGPAYVDLTMVEIAVGDQDLVVRFHVNEPPPAEPVKTLYELYLDTDGDGAGDHWVELPLAPDVQAARFWDWDALEPTLIEAPTVSGNVVIARVPLALLSPVTDLRFNASATAHWGAADDPDGFGMFAFDRTPDAGDEWAPLEPQGIAPLDLASTLPSQVGDVALHNEDLTTADAEATRASLLTIFGSPDVDPADFEFALATPTTPTPASYYRVVAVRQRGMAVEALQERVLRRWLEDEYPDILAEFVFPTESIDGKVVVGNTQPGQLAFLYSTGGVLYMVDGYGDATADDVLAELP